MKINSLAQYASRSRGITLVEILMVVGLLAILISFAIPSVGGAAAQAEMTATVENFEYSIQATRNIARMNETGVSLHFETLPHEAGQRITFTSPDQSVQDDVRLLQDYRPPRGIQFIPDHDSFVFDEKGLVKNPGNVQLISIKNESITETLRIE